MIRVDGVDYGTATQIANALGPDVTPAMVRNWAQRDGLRAVRIGREVRYPLHQAATIEANKRRSRRGRPRQLDDHSHAAIMN